MSDSEGYDSEVSAASVPNAVTASPLPEAHGEPVDQECECENCGPEEHTRCGDIVQDPDNDQCVCGVLCCPNCVFPHIETEDGEQVLMCCLCIKAYIMHGQANPLRPGDTFFDPPHTFVHMLEGAWPTTALLYSDVTLGNFYRLRDNIVALQQEELEENTHGMNAQQAHIRLRILFEAAYAEAHPDDPLPEIAPLAQPPADPDEDPEVVDEEWDGDRMTH